LIIVVQVLVIRSYAIIEAEEDKWYVHGVDNLIDLYVSFVSIGLERLSSGLPVQGTLDSRPDPTL